MIVNSERVRHCVETSESENNNNYDPKVELRNLRLKNPNRLICAHLNINSIRNKFESLTNIIKDRIDILMISETKLDLSFPKGQFQLHGYSEPYRLDRNGYGGGILFYIREDIPSKIIESKMKIEGFFVELNLRRKKWLLCCSYNPKYSQISHHLEEIGKDLDILSSNYENILLLGDFNTEPSDTALSNFCEIYNLKNLIKDKTCFKNPEKPSCIDLIITNRPNSFQNSMVIETGLSDFHKMCVTVMKMYCVKQKPNIVHYRKFKNFDNDLFLKDLKKNLDLPSNDKTIPFSKLREFVNLTLEKHAPSKTRYVRANQAPYINKKISKEIMKRSRLRNKFLNTRSEFDRKSYNKQRNLVVSLLRKTKKEFYGNLNTNILSENRTFWKTVKPFLSEKSQKTSKITLIENEEIISDDKQIAKIFNDYFISIPILNMPTNQEFDFAVTQEVDPVLRIIEKYQNHPSVKLLNSKNKLHTFKFRETNINEIKRYISSLDPKKVSQKSDMNTNILKKNVFFFAEYVCNDINASILNAKFHNELKEADIIPAHKKKSKLSKENYRPNSILPNISKVYERCLYDQISDYFQNIFSKYQCGFRKGYSAQHCLLVMIEKWKKMVDWGGVLGALLTDLSKAFDCIPHDLIIAKLAAYGFQMDALKLMYDYLSNRKQRVKMNEEFSPWSDMKYGVPQGSILGPLLFNIHLCDLFYFLEDIDIASYADDTTLYIVKETKESVINALETSSAKLFKWFSNNFMKANSELKVIF